MSDALARRGLITDVHLKIIRGVASGHTTEQMGRNLGISVHTVKTHLRRMYRRLGATDRATLVLIAVKRGYVDPDDYPLPPLCYDWETRPPRPASD